MQSQIQNYPLHYSSPLTVPKYSTWEGITIEHHLQPPTECELCLPQHTVCILLGDFQTDFTTAIDGTLHLTAELARRLIGAHQAAASLIIQGNWRGMRKYFSLSPKYATWYSYRTPAVGFGIHAEVVAHNTAMRFTQAELERHPHWKHFGVEAGKHPPMRGWLAVPLLGHDGRNYGLLQLSDKYNDADFTEEDEAQLTELARLTATTLGALRRLYENSAPGQQ